MKHCQLYVNRTGSPEGNKRLNSHRYRWDKALKENKERCYVCGCKGTARIQPHRSKFCTAPGGGDEFENIRDKVEDWIVKELPLRPGRIKPIIPPEEGKTPIKVADKEKVTRKRRSHVWPRIQRVGNRRRVRIQKKATHERIEHCTKRVSGKTSTHR